MAKAQTKKEKQEQPAAAETSENMNSAVPEENLAPVVPEENPETVTEQTSEDLQPETILRQFTALETLVVDGQEYAPDCEVLLTYNRFIYFKTLGVISGEWDE